MGTAGSCQDEPSPPGTDRARCQARHTVVLLASIVAVIAVVNVANELSGRPFWTVTRFMDMNEEASIPTWVSSLLMAAAAVQAWRCRHMAWALQLRHAWAFGALSSLLWVMSADEIVQAHEYFGGKLKLLMHASSLWIGVGLLGVPIALLFAAIAVLTWRIASRVRWVAPLLAVGLAATFLAGVVLEGLTMAFLQARQHDLKLVLQMEIIVEETVEMVGIVLLLAGLLMWAARHAAPSPETPQRSANLCPPDQT